MCVCVCVCVWREGNRFSVLRQIGYIQLFFLMDSVHGLKSCIQCMETQLFAETAGGLLKNLLLCVANSFVNQELLLAPVLPNLFQTEVPMEGGRELGSHSCHHHLGTLVSLLF